MSKKEVFANFYKGATTEIEKLDKATERDAVLILQEFIEWLVEEKICLARIEDGSFIEVMENRQSLIYRFLEIDERKLELERRKIYEDFFKDNQ